MIKATSHGSRPAATWTTARSRRSADTWSRSEASSSSSRCSATRRSFSLAPPHGTPTRRPRSRRNGRVHELVLVAPAAEPPIRWSGEEAFRKFTEKTRGRFGSATGSSRISSTPISIIVDGELPEGITGVLLLFRRDRTALVRYSSTPSVRTPQQRSNGRRGCPCVRCGAGRTRPPVAPTSSPRARVLEGVLGDSSSSDGGATDLTA